MTGDLTVKIAKLGHRSLFPSMVQPRRRFDVALPALVRQAWIEGVSTRKVDDLVAALRAGSGISKSEVSRICSQLDVEVDAWRTRSLIERATPYVFLDATYCNARVNGRVVSRAAVIATGVTADGHREVLGCSVGDSETEDFWTEFLRGLRDRGLHGVQLVVSDSHRGLTNAVSQVMSGAAWHHCRVHFMHNALASDPRACSRQSADEPRTTRRTPCGRIRTTGPTSSSCSPPRRQRSALRVGRTTLSR